MRPSLFTAFLLFTLGLQAQSRFAVSDLQNLKWLQGSWKGMNGSTPFYEGWRFFNDSVLVNFSLEVTNGDTLIRESSVLRLRNGLLSLGTPPAEWLATRLTVHELVLKNDSLRFSNTIIWLHTPEGHWLTILEHPRSTVYYNMVRDEALDLKLESWIRARTAKKD